MTDKLDEIFARQKELDGFIKESRNLEYTFEEWIQKKSLALINEVSELNCEVNYKWWKNKKELDYGKIKEELVDILHFLIGMCVDSGLTAEETYNIYLDKNRENHDRQTGKSQKSGYKHE
jgi:dimeric dUTPase (all-alpha-NTP-PPase superfamily)